ncbi:MAG: VWA domain-containing protein, partial [Gammaproteobacteria bacterium]|nr:VWA domain-containing protein [Gammaproteobacteria bacterium]
SLWRQRRSFPGQAEGSHEGPQPPAPRRGLASGAGRKAASFIRGKEGAAMVVTLSFLMLLLVGVGTQMTNYAWREAQWEEYRAAQRAAVAALGDLLEASTPTEQQRAQQVLQDVLAALQPGLTPSAVTITQNPNDTITVTFVGGTLTLSDLWGGGGSTVSLPSSEVVVKLDFDRYEVALAMDVSGSMRSGFDASALSVGPTRMNALKSALREVVAVMRRANNAQPGTLMTAIVPFASLVNVADTASPLPLASPSAPPGRTAAKERYVRMLAGALNGGNPIDIGSSATSGSALHYAKAAADNAYGQWVDTFQRYGDGEDLGPLRSQGLPTALLENRDWNLRRTNQQIDISAQRPNRPDWVVDDIDFWNGCLMARWGAYWATRNDTAQNRVWPVTMDAPKWSPRGAELQGVPLHLSDVPPDAAQPHTLFTAYSWPDASISAIDPGAGGVDTNRGPGSADHWLQMVMARMLRRPGVSLPLSEGVRNLESIGKRHYNDWTVDSRVLNGNAVNGGNAMCPESPLIPLTDDPDIVEAFANSVVPISPGVDAYTRRVIRLHGGVNLGDPGHEATYLVRGVVWALRTLSPLWQSVWKVQDAQMRNRPVVTCAAGETAGCDVRTRKSIVLISDGTSIATRFFFPNTTTTSAQARDANPPMTSRWQGRSLDPYCDPIPKAVLQDYSYAWYRSNERQFNGAFRSRVNLTRSNRFNPNPADPSDRILEAFEVYEDQYPSLASSTTRRAARANALRQFTPWEFFSLPRDGSTGPAAADAIMDPANEFVDLSSGGQRGFGRPVQIGSGMCKPQIPFGPYGGFDELVLVGTDGVGNAGPRRPPALGQAPFEHNNGYYRYGSNNHTVHQGLTRKLNGWLDEVCEMVGKRGVALHAVYLGGTNDDVEYLRSCVAAAGGDPDTRLFVTPNAGTLEQTLLQLFAVRRTLTFI